MERAGGGETRAGKIAERRILIGQWGRGRCFRSSSWFQHHVTPGVTPRSSSFLAVPVDVCAPPQHQQWFLPNGQSAAGDRTLLTRRDFGSYHVRWTGRYLQQREGEKGAGLVDQEGLWRANATANATANAEPGQRDPLDTRTEDRLSVTSVESVTFASADYPSGAVQPGRAPFSLLYISPSPQAAGFINAAERS